MLSLYGGSFFDSLDDFRLAAFKKKNAKKSMNSIIQVANLPPISAAARQHFFRTYCQVQQWLENDISPTAWRWLQSNGPLLSIPKDLPLAQDKLILIVSCDCKAGYVCGCGCRRAGMPCSPICNLYGTRIQQCTGTDWHFGGLT